ncbi:3-deoxy-D-manno-octulosonic-acid transferase [Larkinella arboricola]|uniref:3-deoxy-D-manno-octulosonic acid transferase n=1 Tax=Larkinella arboricola TaxID=643671 RepID=A0A327XFL1_LARAB|nr:glycosyltransferase N-terminal domain-containing protein [Larkinella arboricola]RAK02976.1 3-deoxy-D-manno-octulosonic-acid transferase [Larkinella arboricola]
MLAALYTTSIRLYQATLQIAARFHLKARLAVQGRTGWIKQINAKLADNTAPIAWFHAASLGEFEQGRPVMETFRQQYPGYKILLTFFSPSGYEVRKNYAGADFIFYLPFDTPENARRFVEMVNPAIAFFIKYEFWYNYLRELKSRQVPVLSFSAIFRPDQIFFKPYGGFYRSFLHFFDHILVQNQESVDLLKGIGITQVTLAGDTRFDRVKQVADARKEIPVARDFKDGKPLLVIGSAWQADMDVLITFLNRFDRPLKVIIAPHEIHNDEIERWRSQLPGQTVRFSEAANHSSLQPFNQLIIDNIGMLSSLYQYGEFAYIGGAFGKGLHNILEAATFRMPLFFGPNYGKFQEAVDLVKAGAAFPVTDSASLETVFRRLYEDPSKASAISGDYVTQNTGATSKVMDVVNGLAISRS